ncbi:F0F1 ATP synthase subunit B [Kibdelosporangium aridum]|uniref:ATP synthase subunit b n=1 Tax=Kibdelosporangium aridum TaxID=2030 RepID=A0A1W2EWW4_KIBAR|nr:F0F1 ATP synthase subunit B [Kibdelosporangium aridum]SMD14052.1 F-type H+-transporting ATPase subunit b [Kibdelosporangium aridum]
MFDFTAQAVDPSKESPVFPSTLPVEVPLGIALFIILYVFIAKVVVPRFEKLYTERQNRIEGRIDEAESLQAQAQQALENYQEQIHAAQAEAARIRDEARAEGNQVLAEVRAQAKAEADQLIMETRADLETQRVQVKAELGPEVSRIAVELASRVLGESAADVEADARRRGTIDRFLAERG